MPSSLCIICGFSELHKYPNILICAVIFQYCINNWIFEYCTICFSPGSNVLVITISPVNLDTTSVTSFLGPAAVLTTLQSEVHHLVGNPHSRVFVILNCPRHVDVGVKVNQELCQCWYKLVLKHPHSVPTLELASARNCVSSGTNYPPFLPKFNPISGMMNFFWRGREDMLSQSALLLNLVWMNCQACIHKHKMFLNKNHTSRGGKQSTERRQHRAL